MHVEKNVLQTYQMYIEHYHNTSPTLPDKLVHNPIKHKV